MSGHLDNLLARASLSNHDLLKRSAGQYDVVLTANGRLVS